MILEDKGCSDEILVQKAQRGDIDAEEAIMRKYKGTVKIKANMYYMAGGDEDDIVQEGMIGLLKAIRKYDAEKDASFSTFAGLCISRQIISALRSADREKHKPLNTSLSLSKPVEDDSGSEFFTLEDTLKNDTAENPETLMIIRDVVDYIRSDGDKILSDFELQVFNEAIRDRDYEKIARKLGKNTKSVENAMQRIKRKIVNYLWH